MKVILNYASAMLIIFSIGVIMTNIIMGLVRKILYGKDLNHSYIIAYALALIFSIIFISLFYYPNI